MKPTKHFGRQLGFLADRAHLLPLWHLRRGMRVPSYGRILSIDHVPGATATTRVTFPDDIVDVMYYCRVCVMPPSSDLAWLLEPLNPREFVFYDSGGETLWDW